MNILILNGSPRPTGNTIRMAEAFRTGAESAGHHVRLISVCRLDIHDCRACEACHASADGKCIQHDGMDVIYPLLAETDMLVLASPYLLPRLLRPSEMRHRPLLRRAVSEGTQARPPHQSGPSPRQRRSGCVRRRPLLL